ncbi:hypothetical protein WMF38_06825 [Sorangium sp. So ce118]
MRATTRSPLPRLELLSTADAGAQVRIEGLLAGRSARVVTTMDSPSWWYRFWHRRSVHASFVNATLRFVGFGPVRETTYFNQNTRTPGAASDLAPGNGAHRRTGRAAISRQTRLIGRAFAMARRMAGAMGSSGSHRRLCRAAMWLAT